MRQAIVTKFVPATNTRPSRVKATAEAGSAVLSWDHGMNQADNHRRAALALADRFGWGGDWHGGGMPNSSGYVWVDISE